MAERTIIGAGSVVRGNVRGDGDLEIAGRVEGVIDVTGEVLLLAGGTIQATVRASRIVIRGAVSGDLVGDTSVHLEAGARVVGDVRSPAIAMAEGALLRGRLETENAPVRDATQTQQAQQTHSRQASLPAMSSAPVAERRPAVIHAPAVDERSRTPGGNDRSRVPGGDDRGRGAGGPGHQPTAHAARSPSPTAQARPTPIAPMPGPAQITAARGTPQPPVAVGRGTPQPPVVARATPQPPIVVGRGVPQPQGAVGRGTPLPPGAALGEQGGHAAQGGQGGQGGHGSQERRESLEHSQTSRQAPPHARNVPAAPLTTRAAQSEPKPATSAASLGGPGGGSLIETTRAAENDGSREGANRPPPPVVPALRKPMKGSLRKTRGGE